MIEGIMGEETNDNNYSHVGDCWEKDNNLLTVIMIIEYGACGDNDNTTLSSWG